jgi:hypothetical protein
MTTVHLSADDFIDRFAKRAEIMAMAKQETRSQKEKQQIEPDCEIRINQFIQH